MSWTTAGLVERFQLYLGRGNGGVMAADELWTTTRIYTWLADAQESVYGDLSPIAPAAFVSAPVQLTTADGGITYTYPGSVYPIGHTEVYAQESGGRDLYATTYSQWGGDFVIEGARIRAPGNRPRTYSVGPWARYTGFPARIGASTEPSLQPEPARELILWKALENAAEVSNGAMDATVWTAKYQDARRRWITVWGTQYRAQGTGALGSSANAWWLNLSAMDGGGRVGGGSVTIDGGDA